MVMSDQSAQKVSQQSEQRRQTATLHRDVCHSFGRVLKEARTRSGLSQQKLADGAGADRSYLSMLERGLQQPTLTMLLRIAMALHMQPEDLVRTMRELLPEREGK
jgi:transcriptional regulator with XRE-family HTH domain